MRYRIKLHFFMHSFIHITGRLVSTKAIGFTAGMARKSMLHITGIPLCLLCF